MSKAFWAASAFASIVAAAAPAFAGPPFLTDDPAPTDYQHYEILLFGAGARAHGGESGDVGIDFNYGGAPDLQLTAALPLSFDHPNGAQRSSGVGNIELAAKYRFLHEETFGWDVAVFPRVFVPSGSDLSDDHASLLLPIWVGRHFGPWSTFGGGGCALNRGGDSQDYCVAGWALSRNVTPNLQLGAELFHQTADVEGGADSTTLGFGATYDLNENIHFLGWAGSGLQNAAETDRSSWYASVLFTF